MAHFCRQWRERDAPAELSAGVALQAPAHITAHRERFIDDESLADWRAEHLLCPVCAVKLLKVGGWGVWGAALESTGAKKGGAG